MVTTDGVWAALGEVADPEYPLSIVDMGMVYAVRVRDTVAEIDMTFTSIGCPAIDMIVDDVRREVLDRTDATEVRVDVLWSPPWTSERITPAGRRVLAAHGVVN